MSAWITNCIICVEEETEGKILKTSVNNVYDIHGLFVLPAEGAHRVMATTYCSTDLTTQPLPMYFSITGRFKYVNSDDEKKSSTMFVECSEDAYIFEQDVQMRPPVVSVYGYVHSQNDYVLNIKLNDLWFNTKEQRVAFTIQGQLSNKKFKDLSKIPDLTNQPILVMGNLIDPRFVRYEFFMIYFFNKITDGNSRVSKIGSKIQQFSSSEKNAN